MTCKIRNKKAIITIMLALVAIAGQAKTFKTIKNPVAMAHNIYGGELKAREVIFGDTATTVHFTMDYPKGQWFSINSTSFLLDEEGNRYPLRSAEGITLNKYGESTGPTDFTLNFEPMPMQVQVFDYREGDGSRAFYLLGIHDKKTNLKVPTIQELSNANPWAVPEDWFKTDTITIQGRIEGFNAERLGFDMLHCYYNDEFEKGDAVQVLNIAPDGTFCKKFKISYPFRQLFWTKEAKTQFDEIPFFARPGETIDITVKKDNQGRYVCFYNSGSSRDVERWLRSEDYSDVFRPLSSFTGKLEEGNSLAESVWQNAVYRLQTVSRREHYTPMEMQLALADIQANFIERYLSYVDNYASDLVKYEEHDGKWNAEILDSVEYEKIYDAKNYYPLRRIDFDNPLLLAHQDFHFTLNRIQYANYVSNRKYKGLRNEHGGMEVNFKNYSAALSNYLAALRDLMGTDKDRSTSGFPLTRLPVAFRSHGENMMSQLCAYKDMLSDFDNWVDDDIITQWLSADTTDTEARKREIINNWPTRNKMLPLYLATFTNPYIHQKAEQFYAYKKSQANLATPLPDAPMADLIRSLCAKYPGKILMIDFWGMSCGPCRGAIQASKELRAGIAKRDDVKLVFIAGERTAEGSAEYRKYVAEWLADEETVCVTNADFARLQELFQFNGIPHYETITPDCRRVRDELRIDGYNNFDIELNQLKEKLAHL